MILYRRISTIIIILIGFSAYAQVFAPFAFWGQKTAWRPTDLGVDLQAWYDANDSTTIRSGVAGISQANDGDLVTQWSDKSGNNFHATQSVGGREPTYNATGWSGGLPTVTWNASNAGLVATGMTWQTYTIALVIRHTDTTSVRALMTKRSAVSANFFWFTFTGNRYFWDQNGNRLDTTYTPNTVSHSIYLLHRPLTGTNRVFYVDGTQVGFSATNTNDNNTNSLIIGNDYSAANRAVSANISEIVISNADLSLSNRQKIEGYLAWKWGLVGSLPALHPYKIIAP